ncbi:hypothetical protein [Anaerovibrio slackiae]|uniref:hypothetical protein n=1 Tax=Anaerovibrio slackiae TaxID=2652309 RepID=UPI00386C76FB
MEVGNPSLWRGIFLQVTENMTYKVLETVAATKDLENIIGYITGNLYNFTATKDFADEVEQCYKKLSVIPFMYELCRDERLKRLGW